MQFLPGVLLISLLLVGCSLPHAEQTYMQKDSAFEKMRFEYRNALLYGWLKKGQGTALHVYVEGDGRAWRTRTQPSSNPSPSVPIGFLLAQADTSGQSVLYLGRLGQYYQQADWHKVRATDWTSGRFSATAVEVSNHAVEQAKSLTHATRVVLVGFSGGGGIAALLAATRADVCFFGTVAGNLNHARWTDHHGVTPLVDSLSIIAHAEQTAAIPQLHLVGGQDTVITPDIAHSWCARAGKCCRVAVEPSMRHEDCWANVWAKQFQQNIARACQ